MDAPEFKDTYSSVAQRVAHTYLRSLADLAPVMPEGMDPADRAAMEASQAALHAFFKGLYEILYADPGRFGLPLKADITIPDDHSIPQPKRQEINKLYKQARERIDAPLRLLMTFGVEGRLEAGALILPPVTDEAQKKALKAMKPFLAALETFGVRVAAGPEALALSAPGDPGMLPALQALAKAAAGQEKPAVALMLFKRCNFSILRPGYQIDPLELYRIFNNADFAWVADLHQFFLQNGYKAQPEVHNNGMWIVKYQGRRKVKASPLFEVFFHDGMSRPFQPHIKPASANRIAPLFDQLPDAVKADFFQRTNRCNSPSCTWCKTRKGLGPSRITYNGESKAICWYVNGNINQTNEEMKEVVRSYVRLHESLA